MGRWRGQRQRQGTGERGYTGRQEGRQEGKQKRLGVVKRERGKEGGKKSTCLLRGVKIIVRSGRVGKAGLHQSCGRLFPQAGRDLHRLS